MIRIARFRLGVAVAALMVPGAAWAECATTTAVDGTVTLACTDTSTTPAVNTNRNNPSTTAYFQSFNAPVRTTIGSGVTISGYGLQLYSGGNTPSPTPQPITVVNNGTISHTIGFDIDSQADGLRLSTNSGPVTYSGNGSAITNGRAGAVTGIEDSNGLIILTAGQANSITFGSLSTPVSGAFSGESGIRLGAGDSGVDAWFAGGTITATRANAGSAALSVSASRNLNLTMTGRTLVNGSIDAGIVTGTGFSPASSITIATDAQVTNGFAMGAGLNVFSRQGGADVTLTSGASVNVANIGVVLSTNSGAARFTAATGTTINQTGTTGALRTGLWFTPTGTGSLVADLSGGIRASGTGILLSPTNGNASVTIRGGAAVIGGSAGIQVTQTAGSTGMVAITNGGVLTGAAAVTAAVAGTAFTLTNTAVMTGTVNVTGSSVAASQFTNNGSWQSNSSGNSVFSGSLANGGTINTVTGGAETLTVAGNLVLTSASALFIDVGTTQSTTDRILVTGTASLAGSLAVFATGGTFTSGTYTLLTANGGRTGTFSPLTTTPNNSSVSLRYDANNVFLDVQPENSFSTSTRESLLFAAPTVTTNRVNAFSTQIIGRLLGGTPLYDQTFAAAFASPTVQNGVTAARAAITTAGGPGVIIGNPVRTSSTMTSATTTGTSSFSLAGPGVQTVNTVTTFGPASIQVGILSACNVASLPSATRPTCTNPGGTTYAVGDDETNFNTITSTAYTINETRTDTITDTLRETYELNGQVVAVGSVHAEVQSGLFDLGGRLLGRLGQIEQGSAGWADLYAFRVRQGGRRDARGLAGGFGLQIGEGLTLGLGVDHGQIDIDLPGALESGEISLTELGASLRLDSGHFEASLAVVQGFGNAETSRAIIGRSDADYDVRVTGVAFDMGYTIESGEWTLRPEAGIDWVRLSTDAFTETDTLGLVAGDGLARQVRATAGLGIARDLGGVTLSARARYLAVLDGSARSVPVAFALAPTRPLAMSAPGEPDSILLGGRIAVPLSRRASVSVGYDGRLGGGYTSHAATASVRVAF